MDRKAGVVQVMIFMNVGDDDDDDDDDGFSRGTHFLI